ncbi:MAG: cysteine-rich CWC family protein [Herminiimonas sp.]|uniref:cysteine-rich CWC family protein n=1 Tax=Herminiimonas sp. TaxID=1926289 RepID=UPI002720353D|nr:cysteine-rich CWC family protein [Herminiimonas sp.]MDO9421732.1 cysteine-rich CWC family protein [Herminiimonas sp.]MDO9421913.1 cysteine-rich CWC family protein [Herminiimonas sp.]
MSHCSQCGATFSCGMVDTISAQRCWCTALPTASKSELVLDANGQAKNCMCEKCLAVLRASRAQQRLEDKLSQTS